MKRKSQYDPLKQLIFPLSLVFFSILLGFLGYIFIEHWTPLDSLYMVFIILSTVGLGGVHALSPLGKLFTIVLVIIGIGAVGYSVGRFFELLMDGYFVRIRRRRRMDRKIDAMKNHFIICGFGRVGHQVAYEFKNEKMPFVVVDAKPETAQELTESDTPFIEGTGSSDEILQEAGIEHAKGLVAAHDSDTENVYIVLAARSLNPNLNIIARASDVSAESKLLKAGANNIILPYYLAGRRMASMLLRPVAVEFVDTVMHSEHIELWMKEFKIDPKSSLVDKTLEKAALRQNSGSMILTIKKRSGEYILSPQADSKLEEGDILIALGTTEQLEVLEKMVR